MYRIKDPKRSLDFYTRIMGFRWVTENQKQHQSDFSYSIAHLLLLDLGAHVQLSFIIFFGSDHFAQNLSLA